MCWAPARAAQPANYLADGQKHLKDGKVLLVKGNYGRRTDITGHMSSEFSIHSGRPWHTGGTPGPLTEKDCCLGYQHIDRKGGRLHANSRSYSPSGTEKGPWPEEALIPISLNSHWKHQVQVLSAILNPVNSGHSWISRPYESCSSCERQGHIPRSQKSHVPAVMTVLLSSSTSEGAGSHQLLGGAFGLRKDLPEESTVCRAGGPESTASLQRHD